MQANRRGCRDPRSTRPAARTGLQCKTVDLGTIEDAIRTHGLTTVEEVTRPLGCRRRLWRLRRRYRGDSGRDGALPRRRCRAGRVRCAMASRHLEEGLHGQSAEDEPADRRRACLHGRARAAMPLLHGSQGCTSFGLVLFVRHFREAIPLQTTAMSEVATVLGGFENVEQAVLNIAKRDQAGDHRHLLDRRDRDQGRRRRRLSSADPRRDIRSLIDIAAGLCLDAGLQGCVPGWLGEGRHRMVETTWSPDAGRTRARADPTRVNVLPGCHLTPGDLDELRDIMEAFGLEPSFLPDLSGSLDGHIPDEFTPTTIGGISRRRDRGDGRRRLDHRDRRADARAPPRRWRRRPACRSGCSTG